MIPEPDESLGQLIKRHRGAAGLSQRDLARKAGVSIGVVRDLEQGITSSPRAKSMTRMAGILGLTGHDLSRRGTDQARRRQAGGDLLKQAGRDMPVLQILGPLALLRQGKRVDIPSARLRMLLALLALRPDEVVSRSAMIEAVWAAHPPRTAATMIQSYIGQLRRLLTDDQHADGTGRVISSVGPGYRLSTRHLRLDLLGFRQLEIEARDARREGDLLQYFRALERALNIWRGEPLGDLDTLQQHPAVIRLARQRDRLIVSYAEAASQLGWHDDPLPHLEALVAREPFDERACASYIIALAGTGRHAAALVAFEEIRDRLAGDLGLPPGPELRAAHEKVLRQQVPAAAVLVPPDGGPVFQVPPPVPDFTGRSAETAALTANLDQHGGKLAVICGMPGVGKTALALHVAQLVRHRFADGQLWTRLSEGGRPRDPAVALTEILRALGTRADGVPRTISELASAYRSHVARKKILIVADDAVSADQVAPLIPGGQSALLATTRVESASPAGSDFLQLDLFTNVEAAELLGKIVGTRVQAERRAVGCLLETCGGLPLAVRIVGMKLASRKTWPLAALAGRLRSGQILDELTFGELSVRASLSRSYAELDAATQRVFQQLAVLDGVFTEATAATAAARVDAASAMTVLADRSMLLAVSADASGHPRYRLHNLLREFAAGLPSQGQADVRQRHHARPVKPSSTSDRNPITAGHKQLASGSVAAVPCPAHPGAAQSYGLTA